MLDFDVALLFGMELSVLRLIFKLNSGGFIKGSIFQLKNYEYANIRTIAETVQRDFQNQKEGIKKLYQSPENKYLPYALTAKGVKILSSILKSDKASIAIENLSDIKIAKRKWQARKRIGF